MHKVLSQYPGIASRFLMIGEGGLFEEPTAVQTVLGSCVSVTFLHNPTKTGAIFHAILPGWAEFEKTPHPANPFKYVDSAIERVCADFAKRGVKLESLECKVFGGANALMPGEFGTGMRNVQMAFETLARNRIRVVATNVGGNHGRKLLYVSSTGDVFVKHLNKG
jgi:chemotaxis protein CheD